jgi:hypothetical protein
MFTRPLEDLLMHADNLCVCSQEKTQMQSILALLVESLTPQECQNLLALEVPGFVPTIPRARVLEALQCVTASGAELCIMDQSPSDRENVWATAMEILIQYIQHVRQEEKKRSYTSLPSYAIPQHV